MLETISKGINSVFDRLKGKKKITEKNIKKAIEELKEILIESDVNYEVIEEFLKNVSKAALGEEVIKSITVREKFIKIVYDELVKLLGEDSRDPKLKSPDTITVFLMAGLQGSGKTTTAVKIANYFKDKRKPLLIAADIYRPAAIEQLKNLGEKAEVEVYSEGRKNPVKVVKNGLKYADKNGFNLVIIDTAGRMQIDKDLMEELKNISKVSNPDEIFLVIDSMTGQIAAEVAKEFKKYVDITGVILTKFDSDTRGGAALSVKMIADAPIVFTGTGEKITDLEKFYPDRLAQRIIGLGDILTLVEKAEKQYNEEKLKKLEEKIRKNKFDLQDFLDQLQAMRKMGPLDKLISMIPGAQNIDDSVLSEQQKKFIKYIAIIQSMTPKERKNPLLLNNPSRKKRITKGSGTKIYDIQFLLKEFNNIKKMLKKMKKNKLKQYLNGFKGMDMTNFNNIKF